MRHRLIAGVLGVALVVGGAAGAAGPVVARVTLQPASVIDAGETDGQFEFSTDAVKSKVSGQLVATAGGAHRVANFTIEP